MMSAGPHPSVPLTQAQIAQQQQAQAQANELAKRRSRKPTDKAMPEGIEDTTIDPELVALYSSLRAYERRLDATLARKRLDIIDNASRYLKHRRTLRLWISNTIQDQPWQSSDLNVDTFDFSNNLESTYTVRMEGRLLNDEFQQSLKYGEGDDRGVLNSADHSSPPGETYRLSHFFKSISVDFHNPACRPDQSVEWKKAERSTTSSNLPHTTDFDEFTFKRNGDDNMNITINLARHDEPERFLLSPELAAVVDMDEATRQEAMMGIWEYIRYAGLQEDEEKRNFRCDDFLKRVINRGDIGHIPLLGEYIAPHLRPLPPISLPYTIRVDEDFHKNPKPTIYDIQVAVENPLRAKMIAFITDPGYAGMLKDVAGLDDQLARLVQAISMSKSKHAFFSSLGEDPVNFFRNWLSSQKRDLEVIDGEAPRGGGEHADGDEWRRGGDGSVWTTENARETVNTILSRPRPQPQPQPRQS